MNKIQKTLIYFALISNFAFLSSETNPESLSLEVDLGEGVVATLKNPEKQETEKDLRDWLIFVYIAADNNLAKYALKDIERMRLGSHDKAHVLVSIHTQRNGQKISERLIIENKKIQMDGKIPASDSGQSQTLMSELKWALKFPSKKIMVVLWDHGNGILNKAKFHSIRGVCADDTTGHILTDVDLKNVFETASKLYQRKLDIITFDACLMGSVEMAYAIRSCANFMIAAENSITAEAFDYTEIIKMLESESASPFHLAKSIIRIYQQSFNYFQSKFAVSAIDLSKIWELSKNVSILSQVLRTLNEKNKLASQGLRESVNKTLAFDDYDYIDLGDFLLNLQKNVLSVETMHPDNKKLLDSVIKESQKSLSKVVFASALSSEFKKATGLSIYLPNREPFHDSYHYTVWSKENLWPYFLLQYERSKANRQS